MMKYTPLQTVNKCHRELWWTIRLMGAAEVQLDEQSDARIDLGEVEKVLRAMVLELGRIIRAMEAKDLNQRNIRQAREFSLKAKIAKATGDSLHAAASVPSGTSHKG